MNQAEFFERFPLGQDLTVPTTIVLHRTRFSMKDLTRLAEEGKVEVPQHKQVELELGGQVVATGILVKRRQGCFFQVQKLNMEVSL